MDSPAPLPPFPSACTRASGLADEVLIGPKTDPFCFSVIPGNSSEGDLCYRADYGQQYYGSGPFLAPCTLLLVVPHSHASALPSLALPTLLLVTSHLHASCFLSILTDMEVAKALRYDLNMASTVGNITSTIVHQGRNFWIINKFPWSGLLAHKLVSRPHNRSVSASPGTQRAHINACARRFTRGQTSPSQ